MSFSYSMLVFMMLALIFYCSKELIKHFCSSLNPLRTYSLTLIIFPFSGRVMGRSLSNANKYTYRDFVKFIVGWNLKMELISFLILRYTTFENY